MLKYDILKVLIDAAVHSAHGVLPRCDIRPRQSNSPKLNVQHDEMLVDYRYLLMKYTMLGVM
jgi:hypothetical protein